MKLLGMQWEQIQVTVNTGRIDTYKNKWIEYIKTLIMTCWTMCSAQQSDVANQSTAEVSVVEHHQRRSNTQRCTCASQQQPWLVGRATDTTTFFYFVFIPVHSINRLIIKPVLYIIKLKLNYVISVFSSLKLLSRSQTCLHIVEYQINS